MKPLVKTKILESSKSGIVNLINLQLIDDDIEDIMQLLNLIKETITTINFDTNSIGDKGAIQLAKYLTGFPNLKQLSMQANLIGKSGAHALLALKNKLPNLEISFYGNQITDAIEMLEIEQKSLLNVKF